MNQDRPLLGMFFMLLFCVLAPISDALAKFIGASIPLLQLVFFRFLAQFLLIRPRLWHQRHQNWARPDLLRLIFLRSALHAAGIATMFYSLRFLPLADAIAIAYVMPFFVLGLGWLMGEKSSALRLTLCIIGFAGTLLVVQPSYSNVGWPALLPLAVALIFTCFMFLTRRITNEMNPVDLQAVNGVSAVTLLIPIILFGYLSGWEEFQLVALRPEGWFWLGMMAIVGTAAHLAIAAALKYASAPRLAPIQYFEIPVATVVGVIAFSEFPNQLAQLGILVTIGAGLAVVFTERATPGPDGPAPNVE